MKEIKIQIIKIQVNQPKEIIKISTETDKLYERVTGIAASLPYEPSLFGSTLHLKIADVEVFPEEFEIKQIYAGKNVGLNDRILEVDYEAKGSTLHIEYTDGGVIEEVKFPHIVKLYLKLETKRK